MSILVKTKQTFQAFKQTSIFYIIIYFIFGLSLYGMLVPSLLPERMDLNILSISPKNLHSPVTIEDKIATEKKRTEAAQAVEDQYVYRDQTKQNRIDIVNSIFTAIKEVNADIKQQTAEQNRTNTTNTPVNRVVTDAEKLNKLKKKLPEEVVKNISDTAFLALLNAKEDKIQTAKEALDSIVNAQMSKRIKYDDLVRVKTEAKKELKYINLPAGLLSSLEEIVQYVIIPNTFFSPEETSQKQKEARDSVSPILILQGQLLVKEGDIITKEVYEQLKSVGLLNQSSFVQPYIGGALLVLLLVFFVHAIFATSRKPWIDEKPSIVLFCLINIFLITIMKVIGLFQQIDFNGIGYIVPVALGAMLTKMLLGDRFVYLTTFILAVCGSIIYNEGVTGTLNFEIGIYFIFSGLSVLLFLKGKGERSNVLRAGLLISLFNLFVLLAILMIRNGQYSGSEIGMYMVMALISGIASSVLTLGMLPYIEDLFGIISDLKLMELSKPTHPLLRKILLKAPGTYHHSIMVANLAETACEAIGANGLLARVGAYYHDIGKTVEPHYFIENQLGILNPHDGLTPEESRDIIVAHVTEGVEILRQAKLPKQIVDIAEQHHGTTLLKFFYHKAKQQDDTISDKEYRYKGPKARSKESAIVGIADSVEAAVRSLTPPTPEKIDQLIRAIVNDRLQDGQFSECDLTFKELEIVSQSLSESLKGIFHSRIKYPELKKEKGE